MKVYIARDKDDTKGTLSRVVADLRKQERVKIFLIGETGFDFELMTQNKLDGLVVAPKSIKDTHR